MVDEAARDVRRLRRGPADEAGSWFKPPSNYRSLRNPLLPLPVFSDDQVAAIHDTELRVLKEPTSICCCPRRPFLPRPAR